MTDFFNANNTDPPDKLEFLEACYLLVPLRETAGPETSEADRIEIGKKIALIHSYIYGMNLDQYAPLADWIKTYFDLQNEFEVIKRLENSYGVPSVKPPEQDENNSF